MDVLVYLLIIVIAVIGVFVYLRFINKSKKKLYSKDVPPDDNYPLYWYWILKHLIQHMVLFQLVF